MYQMEMEIANLFSLILALFVSKGGAGRIDCDSVYYAELDHSSVIACNVNGTKHIVYWFKGRETGTHPLLSYEDEEYGGQEHNQGEYELTTDYSLKIINTQLYHQGNYTVRIYFNEYDFETTTTELLVYSRPIPACPIVDVCGLSCDGCLLKINTSGELTCKVNGSIPMIGVNWIVTSRTGVNFAVDEQDERQDKVTATWHTQRTILYTPGGCGAEATFYCIASLSVRSSDSVLDTFNNTVRIYTETCKDHPSMEPPSDAAGLTAGIIVIIVVIVIMVLIICSLIACTFHRRRRRRTNAKRNDSPESVPLNTTPKKRSPEEKKKILVDGLIKHYERFCFLKPLPWDEPIPIASLYTTCQCTIINTNGVTSNHSSDYLSSPEFIFDNSRALFIADLGYGKTTFTQHLVDEWVSTELKTMGHGSKKNKTDQSVLIYIHLKDVKSTMILSDILKRLLPSGNDLSSNDIDEIFQKYQIKVLFDGIDELSMSIKNTTSSPDVLYNDNEERTSLLPENESKLTVANLLGNKINTNKYGKMKVWVTSREVDDMKCEFALPYSKVKLEGFNEDEVKQYIRKTCKYYLESENIPELSLFIETNKQYPIGGDKTQIKYDTNNGQSNPQGASNEEGLITETQIQDQLENNSTNGSLINNDANIDNNRSGKQEIDLNIHNNETNKSNTEGDGLSGENTNLRSAGQNKSNNDTETENKMQTREVCSPLEMVEGQVTEFIEINEIFRNFSKTPLLLIMIIHIITCRILNPTGKFKEVNVNKLTTIIRLVITCLESRYVQKVNNEGIRMDIKDLEAKLGKVAFESKLNVSLGTPEYWNTQLGEECVKTALAIGLLKYTKEVGSGGSQIEELAFSSYAGIEFYHNFFQELLAAQHIHERDTNGVLLDKFIAKSTDEAIVRLLQFMFGMKDARLGKALDSLLKEQKMWNNLIDCIHEVVDPEKQKSMVTGLGYKADKVGKFNVNIKYLERNHHRVALEDFCNACDKHDTRIRRLTFREDCAIDFLKEVTLPSLKYLIFLEMTINTADFISIITNLTKRKYPEILWFVKCKLPMKLLGDDKNKVAAAVSDVKMKIYQSETESQNKAMVPNFNPAKGKWETVLFPKGL